MTSTATEKPSIQEANGYEWDPFRPFTDEWHPTDDVDSGAPDDPGPVRAPSEGEEGVAGSASRGSNPAPTGRPLQPTDFGLRVRREWFSAVCKSGAPLTVVRLAAIYAFRAHSTEGTVYAGSKKLAEDIGIGERKVKDQRKWLVDHGWLIDTGQRMNRAIVYRLAVP